MTIKINEKMNLVIPVFDQDKVTTRAYVHSVPLPHEVFEAHFLLITRTFSAIHTEGVGTVGGPRVAALIMKRIAKNSRMEDEYLALISEIRRLTNVLYRSPTGWEMIPFQEIADKQMLDTEDLSEVENAIVFFIVYFATHRKMAMEIMDGAARMWGAQTTYQSLSDLTESLRTSTVTVNTGENPAPASSVPF